MLNGNQLPVFKVGQVGKVRNRYRYA